MALKPLVKRLAASPYNSVTQVQSLGPAYRQFGFMPKMEVPCSWDNSATLKPYRPLAYNTT